MCHCAAQIPDLYDPIVAEDIVFLTMKDVANSMNIDQRDVVLKGSADGRAAIRYSQELLRSDWARSQKVAALYVGIRDRRWRAALLSHKNTKTPEVARRTKLYFHNVKNNEH